MRHPSDFLLTLVLCGVFRGLDTSETKQPTFPPPSRASILPISVINTACPPGFREINGVCAVLHLRPGGNRRRPPIFQRLVQHPDRGITTPTPQPDTTTRRVATTIIFVRCPPGFSEVHGVCARRLDSVTAAPASGTTSSTTSGTTSGDTSGTTSGDTSGNHTHIIAVPCAEGYREVSGECVPLEDGGISSGAAPLVPVLVNWALVLLQWR